MKGDGGGGGGWVGGGSGGMQWSIVVHNRQLPDALVSMWFAICRLILIIYFIFGERGRGVRETERDVGAL